MSSSRRVFTKTAPAALIITVLFSLTLLRFPLSKQRFSWKASNFAKPYHYFGGGRNYWGIDTISAGESLSFELAFRNLFNFIRHPLTHSTFIDSDLNTWTYPNSTDWEPIWTMGLGKQLCIFDMDNREYNETGQTWDKGPFSWDAVENTASGPFNHYLYALIHGYRYNFVQVAPYEHRSVYWSKVPLISDMLLDGCKITVSIDHDAIFQNLHLPFEWLLNHWNFTRNTSFAMALDNHWGQNEDEHHVLNINAGFIITQNLERSHEILRAWDSCPSNQNAFPNCHNYIFDWPAEQGAWGNYIRRMFNDTNDYIEIPCTEANGFPGMGTECFGSLIRHFTTRKDRINGGVASTFAQAIVKMAKDDMMAKEPVIKIHRKSNAFERSDNQHGWGPGHTEGLKHSVDIPSTTSSQRSR